MLAQTPQRIKKKHKPVPVTVPKFLAEGLSSAGTNLKMTVRSFGARETFEYVLDGSATPLVFGHSDPTGKTGTWVVMRPASTNFTVTEAVYPIIAQHIHSLVELDDEDPERIEPHVADQANKVLDRLARYPQSTAPAVFSHGGDAVVLTWEGEFVAKLLTITANSVALLTARRGSKDRQTVSLDLTKNDDRLLLLQALGMTLPSKSTSEKDEL